MAHKAGTATSAASNTALMACCLWKPSSCTGSMQPYGPQHVLTTVHVNMLSVHAASQTAPYLTYVKTVMLRHSAVVATLTNGEGGGIP